MRWVSYDWQKPKLLITSLTDPWVAVANQSGSVVIEVILDTQHVLLINLPWYRALRRNSNEDQDYSYHFNLPQQGTLLGFKQQGETIVDTLSLGLGSAVGKKGKNAVKRQKKKSERSEPIVHSFFFAFFPYYGTWFHASRYPPCRLLTARHHQDHTPKKPASFLDEKQGSWLQEVPHVVKKVMNSADQRVLQLLIWSLLPTRDVRVQIFPQPAKTCFYWFTRFWHQRIKD